MPRPIWEGHVAFGLVAIPVRLFGAEDRDATLRFHQVDRRDMSPIRVKRVNERTGEEVPWEEVAKGYEYEKGSFVTLSPEDFERASVKAARTIHILQTACADEIDPAYFVRPYYLEPGSGGDKPYALLRETLRRQKRAAIARIVIRTREHPAVVYPKGPALVLGLMRYAYELREPDDLALPAEDLDDLGITEKELDLADQLVASLAGEWDPAAQTDRYREDLLAFIERKRESGETFSPEPLPPREEPGEKVVDMMALLRESLDRREAAG